MKSTRHFADFPANDDKLYEPVLEVEKSNGCEISLQPYRFLEMVGKEGGRQEEEDGNHVNYTLFH